MESLEVTRWRRYGKDRLYVKTSDGSQVGWWDLQAEVGHPDSELDAGRLAEAVRDWRSGVDAPGGSGPELSPETAASSSTGLPAGAVLEVVEDSEVEVAKAERPWLDLSTNPAGAEARAQAVALRDSAPVKTFVARALGVHTNERAWRIGADGEEKVAGQLEKLVKTDPRWQVIHAIKVGARGSDIDHLVIGPGGVFTVNTKNHPKAKIWVGGDTFLVNGNRQSYVRNARHEAARASKLLSEVSGHEVPVEGVIAVVNADELTIKAPRKTSMSWRADSSPGGCRATAMCWISPARLTSSMWLDDPRPG